MASTLFIPLQILIGIYLMYNAVGIAFTAGLGAIIIINVLSYILSNYAVKYNEALMKGRDLRNKLVTDMINSITVIKSSAI